MWVLWTSFAVFGGIILFFASKWIFNFLMVMWFILSLDKSRKEIHELTEKTFIQEMENEKQQQLRQKTQLENLIKMKEKLSNE